MNFRDMTTPSGSSFLAGKSKTKSRGRILGDTARRAVVAASRYSLFLAALRGNNYSVLMQLLEMENLVNQERRSFSCDYVPLCHSLVQEAKELMSLSPDDGHCWSPNNSSLMSMATSEYGNRNHEYETGQFEGSIVSASGL